ncbi:MAG: hypothetical protein E6K88_06125 [Thaumarchaeota archaeon]|nr:MAG: hypothetical protein E6K88_06125 [Nitrososphaerota archaeon]
MAIESGLDFIGGILILFAGIIPAYLSAKLRGDLRKMTIALTAFIVLHGTYHIVRMQGMEFLADRILEPTSVMTLIALVQYPLVYLTGRKNGRLSKDNERRYLTSLWQQLYASIVSNCSRDIFMANR